jgi:uncharacterized protein YndB with AHSA1/START domain
MTNSATEAKTFLIVQRTFPASCERVFRAWTETEALERWFRPTGLRIAMKELDLRVGRRFEFVFRGANGEGDSVIGTYLTIERPEKLVFTWQSPTTKHETLVTLDFIARPSGTEVTLKHEHFASGEMTRMHQMGWESCIDFISEVLV